MNNSSQVNNENHTFPSALEHMQRVDWIIPVTVNIALTICTAWILISLIHYGIKTQKWRALPMKSISEKLDIGLTYTFVVVCAVMCLLRFGVSLVFMNIGFSDDQDGLCESVADAAYWAYGFVLYSVVYFLWFRQRVFYTNRMLNVNYGIPIRIFSFSSAIIITLFGLFVLVYNTFPQNYHASKEGCVFQPTDSKPLKYWILAIVIIICSHICMLGLFVFALKHTQTAQKKFLSKVVPAGKNENGSSSKAVRLSTTKQIKYILKKTLVFAIISISCDIFIQVFAQYVVRRERHRRVSHVVFDFNAFLNLLFSILSFVRYKELLLSPLLKQQKKQTSLHT